MKTKKKVLLALLSATCITAGAFGLAACGGGDNRNADIVGVYNQYVAYAEANGETPLTYEAWLNSIKGQPGAPGATGKSAYEIYRDNYLANNPGGTPLTEEAWVASLTGKNGKGIQKIELNDDQTKLVVTYTDGSSEEVDLPEEFAHVHDYGGDYVTVLAPTDTADGLGYQTCEECGHNELFVIKPYEITVLLADGKTPAANAAVTINNVTVNANASGVAKFTDLKLGEYNVTVTLEGYASSKAVKTSLYENEYEIVLAKKLASGEYTDNSITPGSETGDKMWFYAHAGYNSSFNVFLGSGQSYSLYKLTFESELGDFEYQDPETYQQKNRGDFDGDIMFALAPNSDSLSFTMLGDEQAYCFTVERMETPEEGEKYAPVSAELEEKVTYTAEAGKEVYFKLPTERGKTYGFEFDSGVTLTALGGDRESVGTAITSQDITVLGASGNYYVKASSADGNISFKMKRIYQDGEQGKPIALTLDQAQTAEISFSGMREAWYKFTPSVTGTYTLAMSEGSYYNYTLYSGDDPLAVTDSIGSGYASLGIYELTAGTTYYYCIGASCTLTLREYDAATDGGFTANYPKTITDGTIELTSTDYTYFKYVAPKNGVFVVAPSTESQFAVYSDATFETRVFNYMSDNMYCTVTEGQELYFTANAGYNSQIPSYSIKIGTYGETDEVATDYVVKDDDGNALSGVTVTLKKGGTVVGDAQITGADGKVTFSLVPADDYTISLDFGAEADNYQAFAEKALAKNYVPGEVGLTAKKLRDFTFNVKLGSEAAGAGITVKYGSYTAQTNESGVATIKMPNPDIYQGGSLISVSDIPAGYEFTTRTFLAEGVYSYNVVLTKLPTSVTLSGETKTVEVKAGDVLKLTLPNGMVTVATSNGYISTFAVSGYGTLVDGTTMNMVTAVKDSNDYATSVTFDMGWGDEVLTVSFSADATVTFSNYSISE